MNKKENKWRSFGKSFYFAARGILYCARHERNFRIHLIAVLYVFYFSGFYDFSKAEYALLALVCAFVLVSELFNTAMEVVIDKVSPKFNVFAMIGKDLAAGAVMVSALAAAVVGVMLFWDPEAFMRIFSFFTSHWLPPLILLGSAVLSVMFICSSKKRGGRGSQ